MLPQFLTVHGIGDVGDVSSAAEGISDITICGIDLKFEHRKNRNKKLFLSLNIDQFTTWAYCALVRNQVTGPVNKIRKKNKFDGPKQK